VQPHHSPCFYEGRKLHLNWSYWAQFYEIYQVGDIITSVWCK